MARYGGSMSGEHGDGRARSELLPLMYSPAALRLFGQVKQLFDPDNLLNPGVLVDPEPLARNVRIAETRRSPMAVAYPSSTSPCTSAPESASAGPTPPALAR